MTKKLADTNSEELRQSLLKLLTDFEQKLKEDDLREQVIDLIPVHHTLRDLGSSLITQVSSNSASDRIIAYLRKYPQKMILGDELMVVAGISEYARRIRELRVEEGWQILSGKILKQIRDEEGLEFRNVLLNQELKPDSYMLVRGDQDRDAAFRWKRANKIRKSNASIKKKILAYFKENVGKQVSGEELKYLANNKSEWARRVRELRTEDGWPVKTKITGLPELSIGIYVFEEDRQAPPHDRKIPDTIRVIVLGRDEYECKNCFWTYKKATPADPRGLLELHHIDHHANRGANTPENLITLCNVCHDDVHRGNISSQELQALI